MIRQPKKQNSLFFCHRRMLVYGLAGTLQQYYDKTLKIAKNEVKVMECFQNLLVYKSNAVIQSYLISYMIFVDAVVWLNLQEKMFFASDRIEQSV